MKIFLQKKHIKLYTIIGLFTLSSLLLGVRLAFFLKDGTSDTIETLLIVIIAILSLINLTIILFPKNINEFYLKYKEMFLLTIFIFLSEFIFLIENKLTYSFMTFFTTVLFLSIVMIIALLLPRTLKKIYMYFNFIWYPIYLIGQDVYYNIFSEFFSFKDYVALKAGAEFSEGVIHIDLIYFLFIALSVTSILIFRKIEHDCKIKLTLKSARILTVPLLFFIIVNLNAQYPPKQARLHLSDHYLYNSVYSNTKFVSRFGVSNYIFKDFLTFVVPKRVNKGYLKDIDTYFRNQSHIHETNSSSGIFEGKNLIFIVAESFDDMAINEELTPNIYKLMNEGIHFKNHYVPVYPRTTCDSEFIYNTSLVPSTTDGPTCYVYNNNTYTNSIASLFSNKGYHTNAFHSNYKEFYTRYKVYEGFGYDKFYGQDEVGLNETNKRYDSEFAEKAKDFIIREDGPFFSFVTTLSGHSPYLKTNLAVDKHFDKVDEYYGESVSQEVKLYISAQIEADLFVGKILEDLESKNLLNDTVIVFTTDHYPYTMNQEALEDHKNIEAEYQKSKSPLVIWSNDIKHQEITKLSSSFDVLPTLANMFNLDAEYAYFMGHDVFTNNYTPIVFFKDYSWYDGENYVSYETVIGEADEEYIENTTLIVDRYFDISIKILRTDYFKHN